ncbi:hypothetical protein [Thauera humireducens]|uniref:hypothetical protein n=1 Tax=Thauera humireducens TaxID=1134435 RepID=UPI00311E1F64
MNNIYVIHALLAAALFGASTPLAKLLVGEMSPWLLAGLLYFGRARARCGSPDPRSLLDALRPGRG